MSTETTPESAGGASGGAGAGVTAGGSISPAELGRADGRLGTDRLECPHPKCSWWVPEGREQLADAHACAGPVYDRVDERRENGEIVDVSDVSAPIDYLSKFADSNGSIDYAAVVADASNRPRSERVRLLFDFTPYDYQRAALDDPNPDKSVNCGRQVGKTEMGGAVIADAILFEGIRNDPEPADVALYGDVHDTALEMFRRAKRHLKSCPIPLEALGVVKDNKTYWEFVGDARILTGSLKDGGNTNRGKLPKVVVVDESALCDYDSFDEVIEPMFMTHGDDHELYVVSTPRGQSGYHYDAHQPDREPLYFSPHAVPSWANPQVDTGWLKKKRSSKDSDTWRQEYLGEFIAEGNAYIPASIYRPCQQPFETTTDPTTGALRVVDSETGTAHPLAGEHYYLGVDIANRGTDRTVYIAMASDGTVVHIENEETSSTPSVVGRMADLHDEFNFRTIAVDENSLGIAVVEYGELDVGVGPVIAGVPFSLPSKSKMYKRLKAEFENESLAIPKHGYLERETTRLQFEYSRNRHVSVHHPKGGKDDHPDALILANYARTGGVEPNSDPRPETRRRSGMESSGRRTVRRPQS